MKQLAYLDHVMYPLSYCTYTDVHKLQTMIKLHLQTLPTRLYTVTLESLSPTQIRSERMSSSIA